MSRSEGVAPLLKSRDPHLARGAKTSGLADVEIKDPPAPGGLDLHHGKILQI